ncbi:MAG TPA: hypothetical protein GYA07_07545 [Verrucomicrobia bacterium]|nr:hypothetical protein [Verrucomicrobiota bacterium]HOB31601.1 hypothetical protein [Verrucomicrobiota bacterium]HPU55828.1 hypothetical protein [Verrucomicrobiota bacterium]
MERSALYRRALAPVTILVGAAGTTASVSAWLLKFETPLAFSVYWISVGIISAVSALLLVRQQAIRQKEEFWTPPTRRVVQAALPALLIGFVLGLAVVIAEAQAGFARHPARPTPDITWLPLAWIVLYGCALHAAGFFTPRGLRWLGWIFVFGGLVCLFVWLWVRPFRSQPQLTGNLLMGTFFGLLHLAYGTYLSVTERKNAA